MVNDLCNSILSSRNAPVESSTKKLLKTSTHSSSHKEVCVTLLFRALFLQLVSPLTAASYLLRVSGRTKHFLSLVFSSEYFKLKLPSKKMCERGRERVFMQPGVTRCWLSSLCKDSTRGTREKTLGGFDISVQGEERQTSKCNGSPHRKEW